MVKPCTQCGHAFNGTLNNSVCVHCRRVNDEYPIPEGARRMSGGPANLQNLPRPPCPVAAPGGNGLDCTCPAETPVSALATMLAFESMAEVFTDTPSFSGGGGDFGGGGASGSW